MRLLPLLALVVGCTEYRFRGGPDRVDLGTAGTDTSADGTSTDTDDGGDTSEPSITETDLDSGTDSGDADTDTDADSDADTDVDTDTDTDADTDVPVIPDDACEIAAQIDGWLDQYQTPGDGRVFYCHSGSGNYTLIDTDISSCIPHLNHEWDVFPTTLCDS